MSFFAPPTMVKRLADDRAIAEADLSHLKTIIYDGAPMYLAAVVGRPDAKWARRYWPSWWPATVWPSRRSRISTGPAPAKSQRFKRPKDHRFVDALPTNNYGKVVKRELRDRLRAETADGGSR